MTNPKNTWKKQLNQQTKFSKKIKKAKGKLRFDRKYITASDIGSQFYCEQKLERDYLTGKDTTDQMLHGIEGHENIVEDFEAIKRSEAWSAIYSQETTILGEFSIIAKYKDNFIVGRPDILFFVGENPIIIFEFKFSKYNDIYPSHHAQANSYGLILKNVGFDDKNLFYCIVNFKPEMRDAKDIIKQIPYKIIDAFFSGRFAGSENGSQSYGEITAFLNKFDYEKAKEHVDWAIEYWNHVRQAHCTEQDGKCVSCQYKEECKKFEI